MYSEVVKTPGLHIHTREVSVLRQDVVLEAVARRTAPFGEAADHVNSKPAISASPNAKHKVIEILILLVLSGPGVDHRVI